MSAFPTVKFILKLLLLFLLLPVVVLALLSYVFPIAMLNWITDVPQIGYVQIALGTLIMDLTTLGKTDASINHAGCPKNYVKCCLYAVVLLSFLNVFVGGIRLNRAAEAKERNWKKEQQEWQRATTRQIVAKESDSGNVLPEYNRMLINQYMVLSSNDILAAARSTPESAAESAWREARIESGYSNAQQELHFEKIVSDKTWPVFSAVLDTIRMFINEKRTIGLLVTESDTNNLPDNLYWNSADMTVDELNEATESTFLRKTYTFTNGSTWELIIEMPRPATVRSAPWLGVRFNAPGGKRIAELSIRLVDNFQTVKVVMEGNKSAPVGFVTPDTIPYSDWSGLVRQIFPSAMSWYCRDNGGTVSIPIRIKDISTPVKSEKL